jgi:hypothetical protein
MTVQDMHYDFKFKLNKLDSSDYSNFQIPEIDWLLNESMWVFLKQKYGINNSKRQGFEVTQKRIDDLRNLVMKNVSLPGSQVTLDPVSYEATLPHDYIFSIRLQADLSKESCSTVRKSVCVQTQHDDLSRVLKDPYYGPSFDWEEIPVVFGTTGDTVADSDKVFGYTDGTFVVDQFIMDYLRAPKKISFSEGVLPQGEYKYPDGSVTDVNQNCELPDHTHNEIVDLAVQIAAGNIDHPGYQLKAVKTAQNE